MTRDRFGALKVLGEEEYDVDVNINMERDESFMDGFFTEVDTVRQNIEKIRSLEVDIRKKQSDILSGPQQDPKTKQELEELMADVKEAANWVRKKLKMMERNIDQEEKLNGLMAEVRIRRTQHSTLSHMLVETMSQYNSNQIEYRDRCKNRIQRQLEITGRKTTDDEIEEMLESGNPAIFTQGIVTESQKAKQTLADIEARHQDILKLEKNIKDMHDMFMDMAMLVETQGEMIDRIEYHVQNTREYVDSAKKVTSKAVKFRSRARHKKFIIIIIAVIIIAVIIMIIALSVGLK